MKPEAIWAGARSAVLLIVAAMLCVPSAGAHESGAAYLRLKVAGEGVRGELDVAVADVLALVGLPIDLPVAQAWEKLPTYEPTLAARLAQGVLLESGGRACPLEHGPFLTRSEEPGLARIAFTVRCVVPIQGRVVLRYALLLDLDPKHRAYVTLEYETRVHSAVFHEAAPEAHFDLRPASAGEHFSTFFEEGVRHVQTGYDHLLFLAALLLPAALRRSDRGWVARERARDVVFEVTTVVTAFTLAHSLTLALAALEIARLPTRWVEAAIALSVLIAALNNVGSFLRARPWQLAGGFGLVHGFGFAAQLGLLGLPGKAKGIALLGFNLGVEVGQLGATAVCLPLLLALRRRPFYRRVVLEGASVLIAWLASIWLVERALGYTLLTW